MWPFFLHTLHVRGSGPCPRHLPGNQRDPEGRVREASTSIACGSWAVGEACENAEGVTEVEGVRGVHRCPRASAASFRFSSNSFPITIVACWYSSKVAKTLPTIQFFTSAFSPCLYLLRSA